MLARAPTTEPSNIAAIAATSSPGAIPGRFASTCQSAISTPSGSSDSQSSGTRAAGA